MVKQTLAGLVEELQSGEPGPSTLWCAQCAVVLGVDGAAVAVFFDGTQLLRHSDPDGARLDDLQFTLGEGPGLDAARDGALCLVSDLADPRGSRWPMFAAQAVDLGIRALYAFPLQLGALHLGALTCHQRIMRRLPPRTVADALVLADALTQALLSAPRTEPRLWKPADLYRAEVHQATGILSVHLRVPLASALARLRAHAFAAGRPVADVAHDVVAGHLRLPRDPT
ncbi:GAF domain protein [Streptomyces sp. WAC 06783]|uniref:ANTAR domain-containing protein n=1 Tax=Streptomyces sp. WAC 06783 TaxID=2203211 RepID=UPI000F747169|nr:ANTAR domain-containing protein [Streptomyces sp. WAC 06783]RSO09237.1 GAF domain protein [Streptomyces sp. WAC 06783]